MKFKLHLANNKQNSTCQLFHLNIFPVCISILFQRLMQEEGGLLWRLPACLDVG